LSTTTANNVTLPAVALMLAVVFLSLFDAGFDNNAVHGVLFILTIATVFTALRYMLPLQLSVDQPLFWYALFFAWAGISIFWSINMHRTLVEFLQLSSYGLTFLLAATLNKDNIIRVGRIILITGLGVALFGLSQYLLLDSSRIESTLTNSNMFGIFMLMLFLIGWGYYLRLPNRYLAVVCVIFLVALALSGSRGSFVTLGLALPLLFIGINRSNLKLAVFKTASCLVIALLITWGVMHAAPYMQGLVAGSTAITAFLTTKSTDFSQSGVIRFAFWETGFRVAQHAPITGTGLGTFSLAYFIDYMEELYFSRFAHNHYIQTLTELGLIGVIILGGFLITTARKTWLLIREKTYPAFFPGIIAASIAFLVHIGGDFTWNFPANSVVFFIMAGVIAGMSNKTDHGSGKMKIIGLIIVSFLILGLSGWQLAANLIYRHGVNHEARGDFATAAEIYDRANRFYPINSMAFSFAGNSYYRLAQKQEDRGLFEKALERAEKAVELSPVDATLHNRLGRLYWQKGNLEKAEEHLTTAADHALYRLGYVVDLSYFYLDQKRYAEAEEVIKEGLEIKETAIKRQRSDEDRERVENQVATLQQLYEQIGSD